MEHLQPNESTPKHAAGGNKTAAEAKPNVDAKVNKLFYLF